MDSERLVSIVVLNYNRPRDTVECVASLQRMPYKTYRILVVDNCSTDDSFDLLRKSLSNVELVRTNANLGYTGGVNFGIKHALNDGPEFILLLNNDTVAEPDFLEHLVDAMAQNQNAAAAGGTIYCDHDKTKIWYAGGRLVRWRGLAVHDNKNKHLDPSRLNGVKRVSFITGCMILIRASSLNDIGIQDDRFFMYLDDIEFSSRIMSKGYDLLYVPRSITYHKVIGEKESAFKLYYSVRNRLLLISLMNSGLIKVVSVIYFLSVITAKLLFWKIRNPRFFDAARSGLYDYFNSDFYKGRGFEFN